MFQLRPLPLLLTVIVSASLLFGGWFLYQSFGVQKPLESKLRAIDGIAESKTEYGRNQIRISLTLTEQANLREVYQHVLKRGAETAGSRELQLEIEQQADEKLDKLWQSILFDVAQAMETRQYASIPAAANQLTEQHAGLVVVSDIDETNVYLTFKLNGSVKYIVLPRNPAKMGVWMNA